MRRRQPFHPVFLSRCFREQVRFHLSFDASGNVTNVQVVKSTGNPYFDQAAIKTLQQWKSAPAKGGRHGARNISNEMKAQTAALGLRVKSGWAAAVLLNGPASSPRLSDVGGSILSDPRLPETRQPYHAAMGNWKPTCEK